MTVPQVVFLKEGVVLLRFPLDRPQVCIGRDLTNDLVVPDESVADFAAVLINHGASRYGLRAFKGNQIFIKKRPLRAGEVDLHDREIFRLGSYEIFVESNAKSGHLPHRTKNTDPIRRRAGRTVEATISCDGQKHTISAARPFSIGSHDTNDLILEDACVSAFHCRILSLGGRWLIEDLQSRNGTTVNGLTLGSGQLAIAQPATIELGKSILTFERASASARHVESCAAIPRSLHGMIAESAELRTALASLEQFANRNEPVLIWGESGSGKELVARALHQCSARKDMPFLALNCGAFNSALIESELFGHVKGAFTGADGPKAGAFESTGGGTLFLDEIGEIPLELQPRLLRVLESSVVRRLGDNRETIVDTRIVTATHRNLEELVAAKKFREDLFYRLFVLSIRLPPLRERPDDILPLARHFLRSKAPDRELKLSQGAEAVLLGYPLARKCTRASQRPRTHDLQHARQRYRGRGSRLLPRRLLCWGQRCAQVLPRLGERGAREDHRRARQGGRQSHEGGSDSGYRPEHAIQADGALRNRQTPSVGTRNASPTPSSRTCVEVSVRVSGGRTDSASRCAMPAIALP